MVHALASALDVPAHATLDLLAAAGLAPTSGPGDGPPPVPALLAAVARVLDAHEPFPALALDPGWVVRAHNGAARRLLAALDPDALVGGHALRIALHPGGLVALASDDAPWRYALAARAAEQAARDPGGPLAREVARWAPDASREVPVEVAVPLRLGLPGGEVTLLAVATRLAAPPDAAAAGLTIDTLLPADAASQRVLERMARDEATEVPVAPGRV